MGTGQFCMECGAPLTWDEIGLHKKIVNRGAQTFRCKKCQCAHFHMSEADADKMIANFRAAGCHFFN